MPEISKSVAGAISTPPEPNETMSGIIVTIHAPLEHAAAVTKSVHELAARRFAPDHVTASGPGADAKSPEFILTIKCSGSAFNSFCQGATQEIREELGRTLDPETATVCCEAISVDQNPAAQKRPRFWKSWVVSMLGVYPLLIAIFYGLQPLTQYLSVPLSLFIVALALTGVNGRFVAPFLIRNLQYWITR